MHLEPYNSLDSFVNLYYLNFYCLVLSNILNLENSNEYYYEHCNNT